jgi:hypothetical protein
MDVWWEWSACACKRKEVVKKKGTYLFLPISKTAAGGVLFLIFRSLGGAPSYTNGWSFRQKKRY